MEGIPQGYRKIEAAQKQPDEPDGPSARKLLRAVDELLEKCPDGIVIEEDGDEPEAPKA